MMVTESAKNRWTAIAVGVAALALSVAVIIQWWPVQEHVFIERGTTVSTTTTTTIPTTVATRKSLSPICLSTATMDDLLALPHMTVDLAEAVASYRYQHVSLDSWEELLRIDGVTDEMVEEWKEYAVLH